MRPHQEAAVGHRGHGCDHLHWCHGDGLAESVGRQVGFRPVRGLGVFDDTGTFPLKVNSRLCAKPERGNVAEKERLAKAKGRPARADVAAFLKQLRHGDPPVRFEVPVLDREAADGQCAVIVHRRIRSDQAFIEGGCHGDDLEG